MKPIVFDMLYSLTPSELKQLRLDTLIEQYEIIRLAVMLYRKNPTEITEIQIRKIKNQADLYKKKYNL